jgi:hypothetical protein
MNDTSVIETFFIPFSLINLKKINAKLQQII